MKRIIVTADDYGMSRGVNDAIDAGIEAGLITSTNVMTNMEYYKEATKLREKDISVGLHWTLCAGFPVCSKEEIPTLVNEKGGFYSYPEFRQRYRKRKISNQDIEKELKAQYDRFVEICGQPDYWNTHQNTHVDFGVFKLFVNTAKKLNINKMRSHRRVYIPSSDGSNSMPLIWCFIEPVKRMILKNWMKYATKNNMSSPYGVVIALNKKDIEDPEYSFKNMKTIDGTVTEYVIHPSTKIDSEHFGTIAENRIREYEQFISEDQKRIFCDNDFELVKFNGI